MNQAFLNRLSGYAAYIGSTAKTPKGQLRAVLSRDIRYFISAAMDGPLDSETLPILRDINISDEERDNRRCKADPKFRKHLLNLLTKQIQKLDAGEASKESVLLINKLEARRSLINPKAKPILRHWGLVDFGSSIVAALKIDHKTKGRDSEIRASYHPSSTYYPRTTKWEKFGRKGYLKTTDSYAGTITAVRSVGRIIGDRLEVQLEWLSRDKTKQFCLVVPARATQVIKNYCDVQFGLGAALEGELAVPQADGTWVRYGLSGEVVGVSIYHNGNYEHGKDLAECWAEIAHKAEVAKREKREHRQSILEKRAIMLLARISNQLVGFDLARSTGACSEGIKNWCQARGLTVESEVPIRQLFRDENSTAHNMAIRLATRLWFEHIGVEKAA